MSANEKTFLSLADRLAEAFRAITKTCEHIDRHPHKPGELAGYVLESHALLDEYDRVRALQPVAPAPLSNREPSESIMAGVLRTLRGTMAAAGELETKHPDGGTLGQSIDQALAGYAESRLQVLGYRMELDAGAIPGEGHVLLTTGGECVEPDQVSEEVRELAHEWSEVTDRLIAMEPEGFDTGGMKP